MVQPRVKVEGGPWILRALIRAPGPKRFDKSGINFFFFSLPAVWLASSLCENIKVSHGVCFFVFFFVLLDHSLQYDTLCF